MHKQCRVLVTGAGSGVGQAIVKSLRVSNLPLTIISADISPMNSALYCTDEAVLIPAVEKDGSLQKIIALLSENNIDVVMIGSEYDLIFFATHKDEIEVEAKCIIIVAPLKTINIADDKWLTAEFLRKKGLSYAEAYLPENLDDAIIKAKEWGYPIVLKARRGTSSRNVHILHDENMLKDCFSSILMPMLQRVIDLPTSELHSEYTCSVFKRSDGKVVGPFTARRTVRGGTSWHIEVAKFDELNNLLISIGESMDFIGSLNIQLMMAENGPIPFEINSRFSGTTAIRANFGFNEPEMALLSYYYNENVPFPIIRSGIALRYHEELFIDDVSAENLKLNVHKGYINKWY